MKSLGAPSGSLEHLVESALQNTPYLDVSDVQYEASIASVVSPIHRGVESACFDVNSKERALFLKVRYPDMALFFNEEAVLEAAQRASELNIGARLVHGQPQNGSYMFERFESSWRWGRVDDFEDREVLENTVRAKQALHKSKAFTSGQSVFEVIETYAEIIDREEIRTPKTVSSVLEKVRKSADAINAAGVSLQPCHGDGVASNVMISSTNEVKLVDFDSAGNQDPYFDLGSMIVEIAQFPDLARKVLEIYDGECRESEFNRCMLYGIADDLKWALWGFICFVKSPRTHIEFVKYAEWRLLRSLWNADSPDFDRWLRKL